MSNAVSISSCQALKPFDSNSIVTSSGILRLATPPESPKSRMRLVVWQAAKLYYPTRAKQNQVKSMSFPLGLGTGKTVSPLGTTLPDVGEFYSVYKPPPRLSRIEWD